MNADFLDTQLVAYLSLREALGFQMRVETVLLPEFVAFVKTQPTTGPIRAHMALAWACQASMRRGAGGAARRLSMARGFLIYLKASAPDTEVPSPGLLPTPRRPKPFLFTPTQITTLLARAQASRPSGSLRPHTLSCLLGLLASTGRCGSAKPSAYRSIRSNWSLIHRNYTSWKPSSINPALSLSTPARQSAYVSIMKSEPTCTTMPYRRPFSCPNEEST